MDVDLAKMNADKPEEDEELRKKLWLEIGRLIHNDALPEVAVYVYQQLSQCVCVCARACACVRACVCEQLLQCVCQQLL